MPGEELGIKIRQIKPKTKGIKNYKSSISSVVTSLEKYHLDQLKSLLCLKQFRSNLAFS